jgi:simple sugar transport system permease protein
VEGRVRLRPAILATAGAAARLPLFGRPSLLNVGLVLALLALVGVWWALNRTRVGLPAARGGRQPEAARRAGLRVGVLLLSAMLRRRGAGRLAGLVHFAGTSSSCAPT